MKFVALLSAQGSLPALGRLFDLTAAPGGQALLSQQGLCFFQFPGMDLAQQVQRFARVNKLLDTEQNTSLAAALVLPSNPTDLRQEETFFQAMRQHCGGIKTVCALEGGYVTPPQLASTTIYSYGRPANLTGNIQAAVGLHRGHFELHPPEALAAAGKELESFIQRAESVVDFAGAIHTNGRWHIFRKKPDLVTPA